MHKSNRKVRSIRLFRLAGIALLIVILVVSILELSGKTHVFRKPKATSGVIPSTAASGASPSADDKAGVVPSPSAATSEPKQGDSPSAAPSGAAPISPYGNFVSNHYPNLDGQPNPSTVQSVCNTTPGATCYIEFTNADGVIKTLAAQTTDGSGATYWSWDVKTAGFMAGSWQIKAIATLNGQTKTTSDVQNLEVGS